MPETRGYERARQRAEATRAGLEPLGTLNCQPLETLLRLFQRG